MNFWFSKREKICALSKKNLLSVFKIGKRTFSGKKEASITTNEGVVRQVKGTNDLIGEEYEEKEFILSMAKDTSKTFGFIGMETPILEHVEVFKHCVGEYSDIVSKEMFTLSNERSNLSNNKNGKRFEEMNTICLRPEGTASMMRALINSSLLWTQPLPVRVFYEGAMFRRERPQLGRQRQFTQFGVELVSKCSSPSPSLINSPKSGLSNREGGEEEDVEVICLAQQILSRLGIETTLCLNTLGDEESRKSYTSSLYKFFTSQFEHLSFESRVRFEKGNYLRILDSKDTQDILIIKEAPKISEHLNDYSKNWFEEVKGSLEELGIAFKLKPHLVRGLDYYNHTIFEFVDDEERSQGTVLGGGRYNGLLSQLVLHPQKASTEYLQHIRSLGGVGFAAGVERLALMRRMKNKVERASCFTIAVIAVRHSPNVNDKEELSGEQIQFKVSRYASKIASQLRKTVFESKERGEIASNSNWRIIFNPQLSTSKQMRMADTNSASICVLVGVEEAEQNSVTVKQMHSGEQKKNLPFHPLSILKLTPSCKLKKK